MSILYKKSKNKSKITRSSKRKRELSNKAQIKYQAPTSPPVAIRWLQAMELELILAQTNQILKKSGLILRRAG